MSREITAHGGMAEAPPYPGGLAMAQDGDDARSTPSGNIEPAIIFPRQDAWAPNTIEKKTGCELAAEVLRSFGSLRFRAIGASMLPTLWPGDILSVRRMDEHDALPGDIVLYARQGSLVAHRVVKRTVHQDRVELITRGDSMPLDDAPISRHELLGRVTTIERGARRFPPRRTAAGRIASWVCARSGFATRLVLGARRRVLGTGG